MCPLNNLYTVGELVQSLNASGAKAMVTSIECLKVAEEAAKLVGVPNDRILLIDEVDPNRKFQHFTSMRNPSQDLRRPKINPGEDLAFLVYSSGTTGLPKGVMLTHQNIIVNMKQANVAAEGFTHWSRDRFLGFLPMYHLYGMSRCCACDSH